ncbi:MAG: glycosyltransferase [Spirochaetaceae bacterium]|jgi:1,2-diacylglycerol 3-alpha-glucosyltransferase|nr:glycosyltransferase [Spirochaetaceae bacterium]
MPKKMNIGGNGERIPESERSLSYYQFLYGNTTERCIMIISGQFNDSLAPIMDGVAITVQNYVYWLNKIHAPSFAIGPKVPNFTDTDHHVLRYNSLPAQISGPYRLGVPRIDRSFNHRIALVPFDIVHAHCPFVSGNYALDLSQKRKIPMVATFHSKYRDDFAKWLRLDAPLDQIISMIVKFYDHADAVWVPNEAIIETLREYGYKGKIDYVPNGSDLVLEKNDHIQNLKKDGLEILNCDPNKKTLLYVGQHRWVKNIRLIIDSLKILNEKNIKYQMRFVGNGSDRDKMQDLVRKYQINNRVSFIC